MFTDVIIGAITKGVNTPTFAVVNAVLFLLWLVIAYMLFVGVTNADYFWLAPHAGFMLAFCTLLWITLVWFISQTGLTSTEEQQAELNGPETDMEDPLLEEKLKALPLQSQMDVFGSTDFGFDSSSLQVQNIPSTLINLDTKDKSQ